MHNVEISSRYLMLSPGVNALLRSSNSIQFGLDPKTALVVPLELAHDLLEFLDGHMTGEQIISALDDNEFEAATIHSTLTTMFERGLIMDVNSVTARTLSNPTTSDSPMAIVHIHGGGRLGTTLAIMLAMNPEIDVHMMDRRQVSATDISPWGANRIDLGQMRQTVVDLLIERTRRGTIAKRNKPSIAKQPDLIILCPDPIADWPWLDPLETGTLISNDQAHMSVTSSTRSAHVSHIIEPGESACLMCMHHTYTDRDPLWPALTHQLLNRTTPDDAPIELITMAAVIACQKVTSWVSKLRNPAQPNAIQHNIFSMIEWPTLSREDAEPKKHPLCGCSWDGQLALVQ